MRDNPVKQKLAAVATALGVAPLVRIPAAEYNFIARATRPRAGAAPLSASRTTISRAVTWVYLVNVAHGPVVDEKALHEALAARRIAGAGLDVFEEEPAPADNPILKLDDVIVAPHALCWTDEMFGNIARTAIEAITEVCAARRPRFLVNPEALKHGRMRSWLHL